MVDTFHTWRWNSPSSNVHWVPTTDSTDYVTGVGVSPQYLLLSGGPSSVFTLCVQGPRHYPPPPNVPSKSLPQTTERKDVEVPFYSKRHSVRSTRIEGRDPTIWSNRLKGLTQKESQLTSFYDPWADPKWIFLSFLFPLSQVFTLNWVVTLDKIFIEEGQWESFYTEGVSERTPDPIGYGFCPKVFISTVNNSRYTVREIPSECV